MAPKNNKISGGLKLVQNTSLAKLLDQLAINSAEIEKSSNVLCKTFRYIESTLNEDAYDEEDETQIADKRILYELDNKNGTASAQGGDYIDGDFIDVLNQDYNATDFMNMTDTPDFGFTLDGLNDRTDANIDLGFDNEVGTNNGDKILVGAPEDTSAQKLEPTPVFPTPKDQTDEDNMGEDNMGEDNMGDDNMGDDNMGDDNMGDDNMGDDNMGDDNMGDDNMGDDNMGDDNMGDDNMGDDNMGDDNMGDDNMGDDNMGEDNMGDDNMDDDNMDGQNQIPEFPTPKNAADDVKENIPEFPTPINPLDDDVEKIPEFPTVKNQDDQQDVQTPEFPSPIDPMQDDEEKIPAPPVLLGANEEEFTDVNFAELASGSQPRAPEIQPIAQPASQPVVEPVAQPAAQQPQAQIIQPDVTTQANQNMMETAQYYFPKTNGPQIVYFPAPRITILPARTFTIEELQIYNQQQEALRQNELSTPAIQGQPVKVAFPKILDFIEEVEKGELPFITQPKD